MTSNQMEQLHLRPTSKLERASNFISKTCVWQDLCFLALCSYVWQVPFNFLTEKDHSSDFVEETFKILRDKKGKTPTSIHS